jgi:hypothetical protein
MSFLGAFVELSYSILELHLIGVSRNILFKFVRKSLIGKLKSHFKALFVNDCALFVLKTDFLKLIESFGIGELQKFERLYELLPQNEDSKSSA